MFNQRFLFVINNYIYTLIAVATIAFIAGLFYSSSRNFLLVLNGLYIGQASALIMCFGAYFIHVLFSHEQYTRARQYAITTGLQHLGYLLVVTYSVTNRRYGGNPHIEVDWQLLLSRYIILIAGFLQLMAPDLGKPLMYGFNRKVLWAGSAIGVIVSLLVISIQFWPAHVVSETIIELLGFGD